MMNIKLDDVTSGLMSELEKTQKEFWNVPRETGLLLNTLIKMMNVKEVLEIGTSNGYSGLWITNALKCTDGHLTTIEFYEKRQNIAIENFKQTGVLDRVTLLQGDARDVLSKLSDEKKFDMVFIDANKKEYFDYFNLVKPHLNEKAVILADNIISHFAKVRTFINAIENDDDFQSQIVEMPGGLLIAYKG